MPGACGVACEVCGFADRGDCPIGRCAAGTDPGAPRKASAFREAMGRPCPILECAVRRGVDHCSRCAEFPCEVHYRAEVFHPHLLDKAKALRSKQV